MQKSLNYPKISYNREDFEEVKGWASKELEAQYKPADRYVIFNDHDKILKQITVELPEPPPLNTIDGYGLAPEDQCFKVPTYPDRLLKLERSCTNIQEVHSKLNERRADYQEEIAFMRREWSRRLYGYWVFINGKPTYIDGWHYFYLGYWHLDIGLPEYRSRDRKFFLFARFCYTDTTAFYPYRVALQGNYSYYSSRNEAIRFTEWKKGGEIEEGEFFVDLKRRTCYGFNYPKHRREGANYKAACINYCMISTKKKAWGGIQSMDGPSAGKSFQTHIVEPWKEVPFFFKPIYSGNTDPKGELKFDIASQRIGKGGSLVNVASGLQSKIDWANSANRGWYDGFKLFFYHQDEVGKTIEEDVHERWKKIKKCLQTGDGRKIFGLTIATSTVSELEKEGGENFLTMCKRSHWDKRDVVGQTETGLYNLFIKAYDGMEGFIDIFGESIIEDPLESDLWRIPEPTRDINGRLMGAKRYLLEKREALLMSDDPKSVKDYEDECRINPIEFSECFITGGEGSGLNLKIITRRIREIQFDDTLTQRGNFKWDHDVKDGEVVWQEDALDGRWVRSSFPPSIQLNKRYKITMMVDEIEQEVWTPFSPERYTASADPYAFRKVKGRRKSKGGGCVFWNHDKLTDPPSKNVNDWESYRTVCTYVARPLTPEEYAEDMLMMSVFYGAMMFPEINVPLVWDHFVRRGYSGYLKYERTSKGKYSQTPGFFNRGVYPQKIFQKHQAFIQNHGMRERHLEVLMDQKEIRGVDDLTNHDLFVAVGGAMIGSDSDYGEKLRELNDGAEVDLGGYIEKFYY